MIAYHASHEQFSPTHLLQLVKKAEQAGFDAVHSSDHFHPWSTRQGHSGFSWTWLGAAMEATSLPFSMVCAPGQRYHPAIIAQAIATICELYPGRFIAELGSGEALNECITGSGWPDKSLRHQRLLECMEIIRCLLSGSSVSHDGLVQVENARLYTLPAAIPALFGAAISTDTARWVSTWADGLLTIADIDPEDTRTKIQSFRNHATWNKPVFVQYPFAYDHCADRALAGAMVQWRTNILPPQDLADLPTPQAFDKAAEHLTPSDMKNKLPIITSMEQLFENIKTLFSMGADRVILHNVLTNHDAFLDDFSRFNTFGIRTLKTAG